MDKAKMLLLGMFVGVALMVLIGAAGSQGPGRYQVAGAGGTAFYVLDTHTGKIHMAGGVGGGSYTAIDAVKRNTYKFN